VAHADRFGNDAQVANRMIPIGGGGYAQRLAETDVVAGIGFFVQGGAGAVYRDLTTPWGTRDELSALFGIVKLIPGLAWQASDTLTLGASLALTYAQARQRIFPSTSVFDPATPSQSFFGSRLDDAHALRAGLRLGAQFRPIPELTLGAAYASRVALPLRGGTLSTNMSAVGLGSVRYSDVRIDGLALPQELSLGAAWQPAAGTLLSLKISRLAWSKALSALTIDASNPDNPAAPPQIRSVQTLGWHDSTVIALGLRKDLGERLALLAGINHGRRPMDDETLSPIFAPLGKTHITLGLAYRMDNEYEFSAGIEYQIPETVRYANLQLPFGPGAETRSEYVAVHAMLSRRW
jgi:long-chain fatty acid transport protein